MNNRALSYLVYSIDEELVKRLVGYADALLIVHDGENSYHAEYINNESKAVIERVG
ncbi:hypothetical protein PGC35_18250 [Psychrobacillus sp. PGGUH221]|uniref:hypothetical protein n=1 Tax=Psychrobacillus sp. PGGUH221 TaxID=3020058 RepID=UPI0035C78059